MEYNIVDEETEQQIKEVRERQGWRELTPAESESAWEWLLEEDIHRDLDRDEDSSMEESLNGGGDA